MKGTELVERSKRDGNMPVFRDTIRKHARSFSFATQFLPAEQRDNVAVIYAFCRHVDSIAADAGSEHEAREALGIIEAQLRGEVPADDQTVLAYMAVARKYAIPHKAAEHFIEGKLEDHGPTRIQNDEELIRHCYEAAGTVGLMIAPVVGASDERAYPHAVDFGIAMQLTNICRDVREDADMNRCYLPADRLAEYGVTQDAVIRTTAPHRGVGRVIYDLISLADRYYQSADEGLRFVPFRSRVAAVVASRVYRAIGMKLASWDYNPFAGRACLSIFGKVYWVMRALLASLTAKLRGREPYHPHKRWLHRRLDGLPGTNSLTGMKAIEDHRSDNDPQSSTAATAGA